MNDYVRAKVNILWHKLSMYRDYCTVLSKYEKHVKTLEEKLLIVGKPNAVSFSTDPKIKSNKELSSKYNSILSEIQEAEKNVIEANSMICYINSIKDLCSEEVQKYIVYKFFEGHTWEECERKFYKTQKALDYQIKKDLSSLIHSVK